jgi:hypothetical protein
MTREELKDHLAALTREARETDKALDDLRADTEAAKVRTLELKQRSADIQRRLAEKL